jgi:uncharacterized protein (TIGR02588 family)
MSGSQRKGSDPSEKKARAEADRDQARGKKAPGTSTVEWVVAAISGLIVAGAIGFMLYDAVATPSSPPAIELRVDTTLVVPGGYLVQFTARNTGTTTAASVQVEGRLVQDTTELEKSQTTLDFVPTQSRRRAGLYFSRDPRGYRLELRPVGYTLP